ncbi:MAG: LPS-assembly protein LptD [Bdellovibrionales bacterium]|nr:LPS-assembly protein LptD [Bdellovibrionales bacterium]
MATNPSFLSLIYSGHWKRQSRLGVDRPESGNPESGNSIDRKDRVFRSRSRCLSLGISVRSTRQGDLCFLLLLPALLFTLMVGLGCGSPAFAQVVPPDDDYLFREDSDDRQQQLSNQRERVMAAPTDKKEEVDFSAPTVNFDQAENIVSGEGGVLVSGQGFRLQGERGSLDLDTNDVKLEERVLLTGEGTSIQAEKLEFNLETETGRFEDTKFTLEDDAFAFEAKEAEKLNDRDFVMSNCFLSTCSCPDGEIPWKLSGNEVLAEREGYAHLYDSVFRFKGVPLFYTPWIAFPIKQERSSGLLIPEFGYSNRDGLQAKIPIYTVLDGSTDMTFTPFIAARTRYGMQYDYRQAFSQRSSIETRTTYSNETPRDGRLRGTDITNISEPAIDDHRFGVYAKQNWSNSPVSDVPLSFVSDIHWVSDTLFLREIQDSKIGLPSSRYATSRMAARAQLGDYVSSSVIGEWNNSLITPQNTTLQRLPEFTLDASRSFRPFGFNPYGLKVAPKLSLNGVNFQREDGYDGVRFDVSPSVRVPFHYKNYFNSDATVEYHQTYYDLDETLDPFSGGELASTNERGLLRFDYEIRSAIERVFDLPEDNILTTLTSIGSRNQMHRLRRVKHTLEPKVGFSYVPGTSQADLPLFDSFDRIRKRSLFTYELATRLLGSFDYLQGGEGDIEEFLADVDEYETLDTLSPLTDFDTGSALPPTSFGVPLNPPVRGTKLQRELASFRVVQSYDYVEDKEDLDPNRSAFSDVGAQVYLNPTQDFGFGAGTNYNVQDSDVSSWSLASHFYDDRGDSIRARYSYVENNISQVEGNLELILNSRLKLGYYARFDELESEFIEQQAALRLSSACNCWHVDLGFTDQINPDRQKMLFRFTLTGLGDLTQNFGFNNNNNQRIPQQ